MLSEKLEKRKIVVKKKYETVEQTDAAATSNLKELCRGPEEGTRERLQTDRYVQEADPGTQK